MKVIHWLGDRWNDLIEYGLDWLENIVEGIEKFTCASLATCIIAIEIVKGVLHV